MKQLNEQCCAVLLGNYGTKRTDYLRRAAEEAGLPMIVADWRDFLADQNFSNIQAYLHEKKCFKRQGYLERRRCLENGCDPADWQQSYILKIDPPIWDSYRLEELGSLADQYKKQLEQLACLEDAAKCKIEFFNHPHAIAQLLDKQICKAKLMQAGLPVTEALCADAHADTHADDEKYTCSAQADSGHLTAESLLEQMRACRIYQVFVKPVNGSGAAGVSAFRWQPSSGRMVLYTCAFMQPGEGLVNTKRLRCFTDPKETTALLDQILRLGCIVERWYAKAEYHGYSYDLRAVVQEGQLDFLLARLSKGPVTNLHLNNHPLETDQLGLSEETFERIARLCQKAMACFPGLRSAGIDILLEKGNGSPRIIEMNAQGDLIYKDIFHENRIYKHQVQIMQNWCMDICPGIIALGV